jgi:Rrf2 family protein
MLSVLSEIAAMLGKTSLSAIRSLLYLAQRDPAVCLSPRQMAKVLGESPTYLAKVLRHLVKVGILRAEKGAKGGVRLAVPAESVTLLAVVEACQGAIVGNYCAAARPEPAHCSFHRAAVELQNAITGVLGRWTLADLLAKPQALPDDHLPCLMTQGLQPSVSRAAMASGRGFTQLGGSPA